MLRVNDIQEAFASVCGWRPEAYNTQEHGALNPELLLSESGLYFQDAHPLLTLENLRSVIPENYIDKYPLWNDTEYYPKDDVVQWNGFSYKAIDRVSPGTEPGKDPDYWEKYDFLSDFLAELVNASVSDVVSNFIQEKKLNQETRSLLEHRTFFNGAARLQATIENRDRLVGFEITPMRAMGITLRLDRIGFQSVGGSGRITFYLFHSSQRDPIAEIPMDLPASHLQRGTFQWLRPEHTIYLPYMGDKTDSGGSWYLCYDQRELPARTWALNMTKDWSKEPCGTCGVENLASWREITKYLQVSPFFTNGFPTDESTGELVPIKPDPADLIYTTTQNFGLNCEVSVGCDLTDFIIEQKSLFSRVLQLQVCSNALRRIAMNPEVRVNRNQANVGRMDLLYELDGNPQGRATGMNQDLKLAYKALSFDTRGLSKACLACNTKGVRFRVA